MATVYIAHDLKHGRTVAIKVLRPGLAEVLGPDRFLREVEIAAKLVHPHILPLHDSGDANGLLYYVMPYVPGESLRARLERDKQLSIEDALRIARQVLSALSHAHSYGIIHRDIKPENILLSAGEAVVADFGIARAVGAAGRERITQTGISLGTPGYMSPEQAVGRADVDARTDIYAVGCMLYEMLAGEQPYTGQIESVIEQHLSADPPSICRIRRRVDPQLDAAIRKALEKVPADRFTTAMQFTEALDRVVPGTAPTAARGHRGRAISVTAAGMAVAALVGGAVMLVPSAEVPFDERDWILITSFENQTGDTVFDRALDAALTTSITQSKRVNVFPQVRIRETLRRMEREGAGFIDQELGTEVAVREGLKVILVPSISGLDDSYIISARLVDVASGADLSAAAATADTRGEVLRAVDELARAMRRKLGETRLDLITNGGWFPRATTSSLDALKAFTEGSRAWNVGQYDQARALWEQALEHDSTFAWAHASLGLMAYWYNNRPEGERRFERAEAGLDRLTARERLWIRSLMAGSRGKPEESIEILKIFLRDYPDDRDAWFNLGSGLMRLRRCDEAIPALERVLELDSGMVNAYIQMATCYNATERPAEAIPLYRRAFALDSGAITRGFINHEYGSALVKAGQLDAADTTFRLMLDADRWQQARGRRSLALLQMYRGRYDTAIDLLREAITINQVTDQGLSQFRNRLFLAAALRTKGDTVGFHRELASAARLRTEDSLYVEPYFLMLIGKMYARAAAGEAAQEIVEAMAAIMGDNEGDRANYELLQGEVALARGDIERAIEFLELANARSSNAYVATSLARAYTVSEDIGRAIRTYETIVGPVTFGTEGQEPWIFSHYELGQLYESQGDYAKAISSYQRFVNLWQDADPDLARSVADVRNRIENVRRAHAIG
ncbi:MAG: protein kinase [Gemmatimonadetes bacterium]|nr:protein kinase [Gemmatimonadota bacterium]